MEIYCPYCDRGFDLNHDDGAYYNEERREEAECPYCNKQFMVTASMSWDFEGEKADCLNGGEHDWKPITGYPREHFAGRERCNGCDKKRTI